MPKPAADVAALSFPEAALRGGIDLDEAGIVGFIFAMWRLGTTSHFEGDSAETLREVSPP